MVRQAITLDWVQGRVAATIYFGGLGLAPLPLPTGRYLGHLMDLRTGVLVTAACLCPSPLFMLLSPLGRLGVELPEPNRRRCAPPNGRRPPMNDRRN